MDNRERAIRKLVVGDLFHARSTNSASLTCLVTAVDDATIYARRIHTQQDVEFDRRTGLEGGKSDTKIDCVAPLPPEIRNILLALDRRYQERIELVRKGHDLDWKTARYTPEEWRAQELLWNHIAANLI
jgi:hypothetical protein